MYRFVLFLINNFSFKFFFFPSWASDCLTKKICVWKVILTRIYTKAHDCYKLPLPGCYGRKYSYDGKQILRWDGMTSTKDWMLGDSLFQFRLQKWLRFRTSFGPSTPEKGGVVRRLPCKVSGSRKDKKRGASFFASNLETKNRKSPTLHFISVRLTVGVARIFSTNFFPNSYAAAPGIEPTSLRVELHQTGTFRTLYRLSYSAAAPTQALKGGSTWLKTQLEETLST